MEETNVYEEYAVLDAQIKNLTKQKDEIKVLIVENLEENNEESIETAVGKFTISNLKTWTYTPKTKEMEENFKAQKAKEQSTGDATFTEKPSLRFTQIKL